LRRLTVLLLSLRRLTVLLLLLRGLAILLLLGRLAVLLLLLLRRLTVLLLTLLAGRRADQRRKAKINLRSASFLGPSRFSIPRSQDVPVRRLSRRSARRSATITR
jgi:hypothetical protein